MRGPSGRGRVGSAVWMFGVSEVRDRVRSLIVLGLIAGLAGGVAIAAYAGARRTTSAYDRFRVATGAPDVVLFGTQAGLLDADYSRVRALPQVVDSGAFVLAPIELKEYPDVGTLAPGDDHLYVSISRPLLAAGRLPDPTRDDEILVNRAAAKRFGLHVGQSVTIISARRLDAFWGQSPVRGGPTVPATIVGIGDSSMDEIFLSGEPGFIPSVAFLAQHGDVVPHAPNLLVRLREGTDVTAFEQKAAALMGLPELPARDLSHDRKRITHATDLERTGLLAFVIVVALAWMVSIGQAVTRAVFASASSARALESVGFARSDVVSAVASPQILVATTASLVSVVSAVALSSRFPVGLAGRLDPTKGTHADWWALIPGAAAVGVGVMIAALTAGLRATSRSPARAREPGVILRSFRRVAPLPVALGAGFALDRERGERALSNRPAVAGGVVAIIGILAALGIGRGIAGALIHPQESGQVWAVAVFPDEQNPIGALERALLDDPMVGMVAKVRRSASEANGLPLPVYSVDPVRGTFSFSLLDGRPPGTGEIALGPSTARAIGAGIGSEVHLGGSQGVDLRVTGLVLLPQTPHTSFDQGAWTQTDVARRVATLEPPALVAAPAPGVSYDRLAAHVGETLSSEVDQGGLPQDVVFLRNVRPIANGLAIFLALLALASLGHALGTTIRRRSREFAVLRAIGLRPRDCRRAIVWQGIVVVLIGSSVGIPFGIAAGRGAWRWITARTPLLYVAPVAVIAVLLVVPLALLVARVLSVVPGRRAARIAPAIVLRSE